VVATLIETETPRKVLMSQKYCFLLFLVIISQSVFADISENSYYPEDLIILKESVLKADHRSSIDEQFRAKLTKTLSQTHLQVEGERDSLHSSCPTDRPLKSRCVEQRRDISYKQARIYLFGFLHLAQERNSYFVEDQYCQSLVTENDGVAPGRIPNARIINCEHTWPQSRFNQRHNIHLQKTDLHHLYPVDSRSNSSRGNIPFGEVTNQSSSLCQASQRGPTAAGTIAFEPPDQHKGNVARAIFYFSIRYEIPISQEEEMYLRLWHLLDPVDEEERLRNDRIYDIQGNRNPFIDDIELVELIRDF
jgi:deoxyribonuclease I